MSNHLRATSRADLIVDCETETPDAAAKRAVALLAEKGYIR